MCNRIDNGGQFHRDFRQLALLGLVQDRFPKSKLAYLAVRLMLENSAPTERQVNEEVAGNMRFVAVNRLLLLLFVLLLIEQNAEVIFQKRERHLIYILYQVRTRR